MLIKGPGIAAIGLSLYNNPRVEIHRSAFKHGILEDDLRHAIDNALRWFDLDPAADPPKVLAIGPDRAGNLMEIILLDLADERWLVIHAMALRRTFQELLPRGSDK